MKRLILICEKFKYPVRLLRRMEIRTLVKSGRSSLVVAIPRDWIKSNRLKSGDRVFINEENNDLVISNEMKKKENNRSEIVIDIDDKCDRIISRELVAAYINNYSYVIIKGKTLKQKIKDVKSMISGLIALEVVDESSQHLVAKNFLNIYDNELKLLIRRMDNIIRSMISDVKESVKDNSLIENIVERDKEINKINFMVFKVLKAVQNDKSLLRAVGISEPDILRFWEINGCLEKIGDRVKHIARTIPDLENKSKPEFMQLVSNLEKFYIDSMVSFYEDSVAKTDLTINKKDEIGKKIQDFASHKCVACSKIAVNAFNLNGHINDIGRMVRYFKS